MFRSRSQLTTGFVYALVFASVPAAQAADGGKEARPKRARATVSDAPLPPERTTGQPARSVERKKPWIRRWAPQRDMLDLGLATGMLFIPGSHGLYAAGVGSRPTLEPVAFDFTGRIAYMPLAFVGAGLETGVMPTHSSSERTRPNIYTFRVHAIAQLPYRVTPTFVIGGGVIGSRSSAKILQQADGAFHWGLGVKFFANEWIALRLDTRHIVTPNGRERASSHYGELLFGIDVTLRMRRLIKPRTRDHDHDGLNDIDDACPDQYGDTEDGCPANADRDKDGIVDSKDRCPDRWGDTPNGCPIPDEDNDGIFDHADQCPSEPETRNGFADDDGCPDSPPAEVQSLSGTLEGITFASNKAVIRPSSRPSLDRIAATLARYPQVRIEIVGHTDDRGPADVNDELSRQRAEAVKAYLVGAGIDKQRITTRGVGAQQPITDNNTQSGRDQNRRIEFIVLPWDGQ